MMENLIDMQIVLVDEKKEWEKIKPNFIYNRFDLIEEGIAKIMKISGGGDRTKYPFSNKR